MHPIRFDLDYQVERSRLSTFFRLLIAIPWIVIGYVYGLLAFIAAFVAWVAMLFTKRYPQGLYDFVAGYVRFVGRLGGFIALGTDRIPPLWGGEADDYPVRVEVGPRQPEYRRSRTFFKLLLAFPQQLIGYGVQGLIAAGAFVAWWRILFTGKQSVTMHDALRVGLGYTVRSQGFLLLLTEQHPRLLDLPPQALPIDAPAAALPAEVSPAPLPSGTA